MIIALFCYCWCCDLKYNWVIKTNMVSTRKKRQSKRRLLSHLDDFDQDILIGNNATEGRENVIVNENTSDRDFTVATFGNNLMTNENTVNVKTLERCFFERIDREMSNIVYTVEDRIQNAILTAIDSIVAPKIKLAIKAINESSGRDATSITANSERGEHVGVTASFENASGNKNVLHITNMNDETRNNIPDEVSEFSAPETRFDRQTHTHHTHACQQLNNNLTLEILKLSEVQNHNSRWHHFWKGLMNADSSILSAKYTCLGHYRIFIEWHSLHWNELIDLSGGITVFICNIYLFSLFV